MKGTSSSMLTSIQRLLSGVEDEAIKAYLRGSPKDAILGFLHEPEDDFRAGGWDRGLYRLAQAHFARLIDEVNAEDGGNRLFSGNLMASTIEADVMRYYPGDGIWDILGYDGYNWPQREGDERPPAWRSLEEVFDQNVALNEKLGIPFAIFEFGCRRTAWAKDVTNPLYVPTAAENEAQRLWCAEGRIWLQEVAQPVVATYFHHDWWLMTEPAHRALGGR